MRQVKEYGADAERRTKGDGGLVRCHTARTNARESEKTMTERDAPRCDCSLGWRFRKGNGPDPARCPVHGEREAGR